MMPKRKKTTLIVAIIILIMLITLGIVIYLYLTTDMFKPNSTLFAKYLGKAAQNIETLTQDNAGNEYQKLLENNKYLTSTEITANYTASTNTTDEDSSNVLNVLKLNINGKTDKKSGIDYKNIILSKNGSNISQIELLKADNKFGIKFSDLIKQYIAVENSNLKDVSAKLGNNNSSIADQIPDFNLKDILTLSNEEKQDINSRYTKIVTNNVKEDNFTSNKDTAIVIDSQNIITNAYSLTMKKQDINEIYINILEEMKKDSVISNKLDSLQQIINDVGMGKAETTSETATNTNQTISNQTSENQALENQASENQTASQEVNNTTEESVIEEDTKVSNNATLNEKFNNYLSNVIRKIKNKNIGTTQAKITVYETKRETVRVTAETEDYKTTIDTVINGTSKFVDFYNQQYGNKEISQRITILEKDGETTIDVTTVEGDSKKEAKLVFDRTIDGNKEKQNINFTYSNGVNKLEIKIINNNEVVNSFDETPAFAENTNTLNTIILNNLTADQITTIKTTVNDKIAEKQQAIQTEIPMEDITKMLKGVDVIADTVEINPLPTLTNSEINKFNAEFELYQGDGLGVDSVNQLLAVAKNNLDTIEVISENEIKLNISKGISNEELANKVSQIIQTDTNKYKKYNIKIEYDQNTKIIKDIIITIVKKT